VADDRDTAERAKELLVYGPIGLALFLRDTAPQFLRMFVARGRNEVDHRRRAVGEQIDQVRAVGESAAADGGPEMLRIVTTGLATLRERAEEALTALSTAVNEAMPASETARPEPRGSEAPAAPATVRSSAAGPGPDLAIPDYDDLSASQVVDRLDGLALTDLEAIRVYEATHRARNTILGKIDQITRAS
jgi:hypothetical protein